jgi:cellulose synthase/poly-beta-1,6-N-acetylglucosamine synthase-like glycosyltransferase
MSDKNNKRHQWVTFNDDTVLADKFTILETNYQFRDPKLRQYGSESISAATDPAGTKLAKCAEYNSSSVVSINIATRNEESIIDGLLNSLNRLTYDSNRFEVIVVDDSIDSTFRILEGWKKRMENLKIIKRNQKIGWKGGALNLALEYLRRDPSKIVATTYRVKPVISMLKK